MKKVSLKSWVWLSTIMVALGLLVAVGWALKHHQNAQDQAALASGQSQTSADIQIANRDGKTEQITLHGQAAYPFTVEIASTDASRAKGLSGRDGLAPNSGMLFLFGEAGYDCFWMKDMKFDIDMLWFDANQNLIYMQENASKATYPNSFCPQSAASYVLEVPAGTAKQLGLQLNDHFSMP